MVNYYEILGLRQEAGIQEIKSAFRQLAKIYHPDVNPSGKERFTIILKAYEVLSDPNLKYSYDYRLSAHQQSIARQSATKASPTSKNWRFDERELKRRQYYNEHIRKYEKKTYSAPEPVQRSNYNEFKYVLLATPLAVIIFLAIMTLAPDGQPVHKKAAVPSAQEQGVSDLSMGDAPFTWHFGPGIYDTVANSDLTVKNMSGEDIIVCLFSGDRFVRSFYIEKGYFVEISQLPLDALSLRYSSGLGFRSDHRNRGTAVRGGFTRSQNFYESNHVVRLNSVNELTLLDDRNEGFREINAGQFFRK